MTRKSHASRTCSISVSRSLSLLQRCSHCFIASIDLVAKQLFDLSMCFCRAVTKIHRPQVDKDVLTLRVSKAILPENE